MALCVIYSSSQAEGGDGEEAGEGGSGSCSSHKEGADGGAAERKDTPLASLLSH